MSEEEILEYWSNWEGMVEERWEHTTYQYDLCRDETELRGLLEGFYLMVKKNIKDIVWLVNSNNIDWKSVMVVCRIDPAEIQSGDEKNLISQCTIFETMTHSMHILVFIDEQMHEIYLRGGARQVQEVTTFLTSHENAKVHNFRKRKSEES